MIRTEADLLRTLDGTFTVAELAGLVQDAGIAGRDQGLDRIQDGKERYKHRLRGALQTLKRSGRARRVGEATWVLEGSRERPQRAVLVLLSHERGEIELVLGDAAEVLRRAQEPIDLIVADPPWGLGRQAKGEACQDRGERLYARNHDQVVRGYVEVDGDPAAYADFTCRWVAAAADALRPRGGYLAVITGPQQAARVQVAAEDVGGLTFVNQVVVKRPFALRTTRRFAFAHTVVTILCAGRLESPARFFACPEDLPKARSGVDYPLSWWGDVKKYERPGMLRYDNQLPPALVRRVVTALTPGVGRRWWPILSSVAERAPSSATRLSGGSTAAI